MKILRDFTLIIISLLIIIYSVKTFPILGIIFIMSFLLIFFILIIQAFYVINSNIDNDIIVKDTINKKMKVIKKTTNEELNPLMLVAGSNPFTFPLMFSNKNEKFSLIVLDDREEKSVIVDKNVYDIVKENEEYQFLIQKREIYNKNGYNFPWIFRFFLDKNERKMLKKDLGRKQMPCVDKILFNS